MSKTPGRHQSPEIVTKFLIAMKNHKLTKAIKPQLLIHRPITSVEIQLMLEVKKGSQRNRLKLSLILSILEYF